MKLALLDEKETNFLFYTGKQWDEDAQLYYFNARWYDPETGRFITVDPIRDGLLWYAYCGNNPMGYSDHTGLYYETEDDSNYDYAYSEKGKEIYQQYSDNQREKQEREDTIELLQKNILEIEELVQILDELPDGQTPFEELKQLTQLLNENKEIIDAFVNNHKDDNIFNSNTPLNQHDMDKWYGLATEDQDSISCYAAALVNAYGTLGDVPQIVLDAVMAFEDKGLGERGNVPNPNRFLSLLGYALGYESPLYMPGNNISDPVVYFSPGRNNADVGIAVSSYYNNRSKKTYTHYTVITLDPNLSTIDSLDPNRAAASQYQLKLYYGTK